MKKERVGVCCLLKYWIWHRLLSLQVLENMWVIRSFPGHCYERVYHLWVFRCCCDVHCYREITRLFTLRRQPRPTTRQIGQFCQIIGNGPSSLSGDTKTADTFWNITVFLSFSPSSPSNQAVVVIFFHGDYDLFIYFLTWLLPIFFRPTRPSVFDVCASIKYLIIPTSFASYLSMSSRLRSPCGSHSVMTKMEKRHRIDATFGIMKN